MRTRHYRLFVLKHDEHEAVLDWKKDRVKKVKPFPPAVYLQAVEVINRYLQGFDIITVPAPSFHKYEEHYPIWELSKQLAADCSFELSCLFPEQSGKNRMGWHGSLQKKTQVIQCPPSKFVLVLDDILTTGHTGRVTCEAILNTGSFPCFLAFSEHTA